MYLRSTKMYSCDLFYFYIFDASFHDKFNDAIKMGVYDLV